MSDSKEIVLEMKGIIKDFPGVRALNDITFSALKAEVLGLVGENGAGKSTLMKVLSGVYPNGSYEGEIHVDGKLRKFGGTRDAEEAGIAIIHQELNLIPELSVAENIFLGNEPRTLGVIQWEEMYKQSRALLDRLKLDMEPSTKIKNLGIGKQQMVEIAKALRVNATILIMDEPTSALTDVEINTLYETIKNLKAQGVTCIYISHKFEEIFTLCDRVTVIRDGATIGSDAIGNLDEEKIVSMMVGRKIEDMFPTRNVPLGDVVLEVRDMTVDHPFLPGEKIVEGIHFSLRKGEILGIAGLMGSGRSELVTGLFGAFPAKTMGEIVVDGKKEVFRSCIDAIESGIALVTEDRKIFGLVLGMGVGQNITLASLNAVSKFGVIDHNEEKKLQDRYIGELRIKTSSGTVPVNTLSGGNQQKVVVGKWMATSPKVLIMDEPTRGVDVGAKVEIYHVMNELLSRGMAIIMVSSSLPEVLKMSDRILIMREGRQQAILDAKDATQELIMKYATGTAGPRETPVS